MPDELVPADVWLCGRCSAELPLTSGILCQRCGKAMEDCTCENGLADFDGAVVPLFYTDAVARGIGSFKYEGKRYYARFLAKLMAQSVRESFGDIKFSAITYVPLHPAKQRRRGYCQTRLLANELSSMLGIPVESGFLRHTEREERRWSKRAGSEKKQCKAVFYHPQRCKAGRQNFPFGGRCAYNRRDSRPVRRPDAAEGRAGGLSCRCGNHLLPASNPVNGNCIGRTVDV